MTGKLKILFLCTGNSCRSQMAEGFARRLRGDELEAYSAGVDPQDLNSLAVEAMREAGVDISGQESKHVNTLQGVAFDYVVTVCGHAHETCPVFPGKTRVVHVGFDDPPQLAREAPSKAAALPHYRRVRDEIRAWIETLPAALERPVTPPMERLRRAYLWTSPLPLLLYGGVQWYLQGIAGWDQLAAAPMLMLPIILSLLMGGWGTALLLQAARSGAYLTALMAAVVAASGLGVWFLMKLLLMGILSGY